MAGKENKGAGAAKPKAQPVNLGTLVAIGAYEKVFSTGKRGWFGKIQDTATGKKYQVIGAVELAS